MHIHIYMLRNKHDVSFFNEVLMIQKYINNIIIIIHLFLVGCCHEVYTKIYTFVVY